MFLRQTFSACLLITCLCLPSELFRRQVLGKQQASKGEQEVDCFKIASPIKDFQERLVLCEPLSRKMLGELKEAANTMLAKCEQNACLRNMHPTVTS